LLPFDWSHALFNVVITELDKTTTWEGALRYFYSKYRRQNPLYYHIWKLYSGVQKHHSWLIGSLEEFLKWPNTYILRMYKLKWLLCGFIRCFREFQVKASAEDLLGLNMGFLSNDQLTFLFGLLGMYLCETLSALLFFTQRVVLLSFSVLPIPNESWFEFTVFRFN
jgi:hypothetical protein